jgi:hypothetical protein
MSQDPAFDATAPKPTEVRLWLAQELKDITRAFQLRLAEANDFTTAYLLGEISPEETVERLERYHHRWGEALPGTHSFAASTDADILDAVDHARGSLQPAIEVANKYSQLIASRDDESRSR